jgi:hypothetical protein
MRLPWIEIKRFQGAAGWHDIINNICGENIAMLIIKIIVVLMLLVILASLASAMVQLIRSGRGGADSDGVVKALTWRIGLSVGLFLLLMLASYFGLITPHGVHG